MHHFFTVVFGSTLGWWQLWGNISGIPRESSLHWSNSDIYTSVVTSCTAGPSMFLREAVTLSRRIRWQGRYDRAELLKMGVWSTDTAFSFTRHSEVETCHLCISWGSSGGRISGLCIRGVSHQAQWEGIGLETVWTPSRTCGNSWLPNYWLLVVAYKAVQFKLLYSRGLMLS